MQAITRILALLGWCVAMMTTAVAQQAADADVVTSATPDVSAQKPATVAEQLRDATAAFEPWVAPKTAPRPLGSAMDALRSGRWDTAFDLAARDGAAAVDVIWWHYLRAGKGSYAEAMDFLTRNPDWPGLPWLRKRTEGVLVQAKHQDVIAFFADDLPQTGAGTLALARAHLQAGETGAAYADLVAAWRSLRMSEREEAEMLEIYPELLKPHHAARLSFLLWNNQTTEAARILPLVDDAQKALAEARIALIKRRDDVEDKVRAVPEALATDPGLAQARFEWLLRKGRRDAALDLLMKHSVSYEALGEPEAWARRRVDLARRLMREGDHTTAYAIASSHFLVEGSRFADLEWLSGFLSLRYLGQPRRALQHFESFKDGVATPISLGRAGYWIGRAHEALGDERAARRAYREGGEHQTSFYGLLAAEKAGLPVDPQLAGTEVFPPWKDAPFVKSRVFQAAVLLLASDEAVLAERFFTHLAETLDRQQIGQLGQMFEEFKRPHLQVMLGKRAAQYGVTLPGPYYAVHPVAAMDHPVPAEMVLSIARRESEFDPVVVSGAGARGLMQVMPKTAQAVLRDIGGDYDGDKMLQDWPYNARIGAAYLAGLANEFDGNVVMMAAAYNAGPSRPRSWMKRNGDPRKGEMDVVDWIELIPFDETRNYVMRVAESVPIYRARLGRAAHPVPFSQELVGSTIRK